MSTRSIEQNYRINELERKVKGLQQQISVVHARIDSNQSKHEQRIRNLEIKNATQQGVSQRKLAIIYGLSPSRICQIAKKIA